MKRAILVAILTLWGAANVVHGQPPRPPAQGKPPANATPMHPNTTPPPQRQVPPQEQVPAYVEEAPPSSGSSLFELGGSDAVWTGNLEYVLYFFSTGRINAPPLRQERIHPPTRPLSGVQFRLAYSVLDYSDPVVPPNADFQAYGLELTIFDTAERSRSFQTDGLFPMIMRPFFDLNNFEESGVLVAAPGIASGGVSAVASGEIWGLEINGRTNLYANSPGTSCRVDLLGGFRFLNLDSDLEIRRVSVFTPTAPIFTGNRFDEQESFDASNQFYGAQIGAEVKVFYEDKFSLTFTGGLALGVNHQEVEINGSQVRILPTGQVITSRGALLALPSNIGKHDRGRFAQVPFAGATLRLPVYENVVFTIGYSFLYLNDAVIAVNQVDRTVDISQIPSATAGTAPPTGLTRPGVFFREQGFSAHSIHLGLEISW